MIAKDLVNDLIPALRLSDSGLDAMRKMKEFQLEHLPVIESINYEGVVAEEDILIHLSSLEKPLGETDVRIMKKPAVHESQPVEDVVRLMAKEKIAVIAVLDKKDHYTGLITLMDVMKYYTDSGILRGPGGMIVLGMRTKDYSLSEIARLSEDENAQILNVSVVPVGEEDSIHVTLKFNLSDLSRIISSFERHGMQIIESHHKGEFVEDMKSRYDLLMNFLNL